MERIKPLAVQAGPVEAQLLAGPAQLAKEMQAAVAVAPRIKLAVVAEELKKIGYAHVTLDLQGYRRGSTNEVLAGKA